jgi:nucleolar protein 58
VHKEIVMEVMWGIQHLMRTLVPQEKAEVAKDDRFPVSQGLKMFLRRYGFDVEPEMVSSVIGVAMLSAL